MFCLGQASHQKATEHNTRGSVEPEPGLSGLESWLGGQPSCETGMALALTLQGWCGSEVNSQKVLRTAWNFRRP